MPSVNAASRALSPGVWAVGFVIFGGCCMGMFLLEALLALVILVAIVWWTMFAGRHKGELPPSDAHGDQTPPKS